jgi:hypothetical protein
VIDVVGDGTKLLLNNRRWELVLNHSRARQGHVISLLLRGWHLSRGLRTFLARLIVLLSSSELDVRATAHIKRCGQTPRRYRAYLATKMLFTVHCQPRINRTAWSLAWSPPPCWASYRKPHRGGGGREIPPCQESPCWFYILGIRRDRSGEAGGAGRAGGGASGAWEGPGAAGAKRNHFCDTNESSKSSCV